MAFPLYTKERMLEFAEEFSMWGKDMDYLLKVPYAPNTKYTSISRALSYFIYQDYSVGNNRFYSAEVVKKQQRQQERNFTECTSIKNQNPKELLCV